MTHTRTYTLPELAAKRMIENEAVTVGSEIVRVIAVRATDGGRHFAMDTASLSAPAVVRTVELTSEGTAEVRW